MAVKELGERIKMLREEQGLTQDEFSKQFNLSRSTVSQYESGVSEPDDAVKIKIALHYKVSLDWLFGLTDIRNTIDPYETRLRNLLLAIRNLSHESMNDLINYIETLKIRDIAKRNLHSYIKKLPQKDKKYMEKYLKP